MENSIIARAIKLLRLELELLGAVNIIDNAPGFSDETTAVGKARVVVLRYLGLGGRDENL